MGATHVSALDEATIALHETSRASGAMMAMHTIAIIAGDPRDRPTVSMRAMDSNDIIAVILVGDDDVGAKQVPSSIEVALSLDVLA